MKRSLACLFTVSLVLAAGCAKPYRARLEDTVNRLRYLQKLDRNLLPPPQGKFKELSIFVRPPKSLEEAKELALPSVAPGQFDLAVSFLGLPAKADAQAKEGNAPADPNAVLRLHVLARVKKAKKTPKKGEAPPPDTSGRGEFVSDVLTLLATDFSAGEAATSTQLKNETKGKHNTFRRLIFTSPVSNDKIQTYFYNHREYQVALILDVPPSLDAQTKNAIELCLESFSVGPKAARALSNGYSDEGMPGAEGGPGGTSKGSAAF